MNKVYVKTKWQSMRDLKALEGVLRPLTPREEAVFKDQLLGILAATVHPKIWALSIEFVLNTRG